MTPVQITLPNHTEGDTWEGVEIGPVTFDGEAPPAALVSCRMYFRSKTGRKFGYGFQSSPADGFGTITIEDGGAWEVTIEPQALPLSAGQWLWDFETTDAAGAVRTLYAGVLTVVKDVSDDDD